MPIRFYKQISLKGFNSDIYDSTTKIVAQNKKNTNVTQYKLRIYIHYQYLQNTSLLLIA